MLGPGALGSVCRAYGALGLALRTGDMIIHPMTAETELIEGFLEDAEAAIARDAMAKAKTLYQGILAVDETNLEALSQLAAIAINEGIPKKL